MTSSEHRAELLAALAEVEALRDGADRTAGTIRRLLAQAGSSAAVDRQTSPLGYVSIGAAANATGIEKDALRARARRAHRGGSGLARKIGGRWQIRLADLI